MENETSKAVWHKPEIIELDIITTSKLNGAGDESKYMGPSGS